jgi:membrane protease YdiL (CAAX protease family)
MPDYLRSTRHPLPSALFVLPLLVAYEVGVYLLAPTSSDGLRNGADAWARGQLAGYGVTFEWAAPIAVALLLVAKCLWRWGDRPKYPLAVTFGIFLESAVFAAGIWALSRNFYPLLEKAGVPLTQIQFKPVATGQVVQFIGAGIYEEVLFRVILFGVMCLLIRLALMPKVVAVVLAAVGSSLVFAAAHHWGDHGEPMHTARFAFRTAAGLVFSGLYVTRGLGVAVGAHAGYNVLVGVSVG